MSDIEFGSAGAGVNRSGTITAGGAAQPLAPANPVRKKLEIQNISAGDLWLNEIGGAAAPTTAGSWLLPAGQATSISTNRAISVYGATTGQAWSATEA